MFRSVGLFFICCVRVCFLCVFVVFVFCNVVVVVVGVVLYLFIY